jgi:acetyl-CoA carboxylase biotin carboxylase subunit
MRLGRALAEYDVGGIETTLPFFRWLVTQPDFVAGRFDTTFVDRALATGDGPFGSGSTAADEELAAVAAAVHTHLSAGSARGEPMDRLADPRRLGAWWQAARIEGLRG